MSQRIRHGISLTELLVGMVVLGIAGLSIARLMMFQSRYFERQSAAIQARSISRGPLMRLVADLRMVESAGGVIAASDTSLTVRAPYALGVTCTNIAGSMYVSLLPVDSAMYEGPGFSGYAWRQTNGSYTYVESGSPLINILDLNVCNIAVVSTLLTDQGRIAKIPTPLADPPLSLGTPVFFFRRIRYTFAPSMSVPGTKALYRTVLATGSTEELAAPFASTAKFRYFTTGRTPQANPPADLSTIRGVQLVLDGMSERVPTGALAKQKAQFTTAVYFKNRN
jgi:hypothetical protein